MSLSQAVAALAATLLTGSAGALDAASVATVDLAAGSAASGAPAGSVGFPAWPTSLPECAGPAPTVTPFGDPVVPVLGWTENLALDRAGRMWVTRTFENRVDAYAPDGRVVASVQIRAPGGIALGPDGRMHVADGTGYLPYRSSVVTFDPEDARSGVRHEAHLDSRKNGLAVDAEGNRYLTGLDDPGLTKVRVDGTVDAEWSAAAAIGGANGIAIEGDTAYVSQSTATDSALVTVPLDRPTEFTRTVLTGAPVPGLDDLAVVPDAFYVSSWTSGEVLRVDRDPGGAGPIPGTACVLVGGIPRATSVRVVEGFGPGGGVELLVTSLHGRMRHVAVR